MLASVRDANATGAARRRQRRLRQWLRHERLSVAMALAESQHHTAPRGQKKARAREGGSELQYTATFQKTRPPQPELFQLPAGDGQHLCLRSLARRHGFCSAPWSPSSRLSCRCRFLMSRCRRWRTSWRTSSSSLTCFFLLLPSRLSKCPRIFFRTKSRSELRSGIRCWWNSWWKCRLSCLSPFSSSSLPSRTLTLQFLVLVDCWMVEAFKVSSQNRVQLLDCVSMEVFKVSPRDRVPQRLVEQNTMITKALSPDGVQQLVVELWVQRLVVELIIKALSHDRVQQLFVPPNSSRPCNSVQGGGRGGRGGGRGHGVGGGV